MRKEFALVKHLIQMQSTRTADCTICFGMSFISSCRGMSVPTTPNRIPWFFCMIRFNIHNLRRNSHEYSATWEWFKNMKYRRTKDKNVYQNCTYALYLITCTFQHWHTVSFFVLKTGMATVVVRLGPAFSFIWKKEEIFIFEKMTF